MEGKLVAKESGVRKEEEGERRKEERGGKTGERRVRIRKKVLRGIHREGYRLIDQGNCRQEERKQDLPFLRKRATK